MIKCAHCRDRHETVTEVRLCSQVKVAVAVLDRTPVTEPGMYRRSGDVFQVIWNKAKTHLYAQRYVPTFVAGQLHKFEFVYDKGAIFTLDAVDRMTVTEVGQLGRDTGWCWVCHRKLTVQKSIEAGIGPVCAKKV
jgi:hypothetical protein